MSKIVITREQVIATAKILDEANNANAHGYSIGFTSAVKMTSTAGGLVIALCDEQGDMNEQWIVTADGRASAMGKPALF
jgi:hypothetical protein